MRSQLFRKRVVDIYFVVGLDKIVACSLLVEDPLVWRSEDLHYSGEQISIAGMEIVEVKAG